MSRSKAIATLKNKVPARKSLSGQLKLVTGAFFVFIVIALVTTYTYLSYELSYEERLGSVGILGNTMARLVARPVSLQDYISVEQALRGTPLPKFVCRVEVEGRTGNTVAGVSNIGSPACRSVTSAAGTWTLKDRFPVQSINALTPPDSREIGGVRIVYCMGDLKLARIRSLLASLVLGAVILWVLLVLNRFSIDWALVPLRKAVVAASSTEAFSHDLSQNTEVIAAAPREIQPLLEKFISVYGKYAKAEGDVRVARVARSVAHDIRSPVAALQMITRTSKALPEKDRVILRQAVTRIHDIANDLMVKFPEVAGLGATGPAALTGPTGVPGPQLIPILIDEIVTEMRIRFRNKNALEITANLDETNYGLFAVVEIAKFKRALSNLIQNAVEAIQADGFVRIQSWNQSGEAWIEIIDSGRGMTPEVMSRLGPMGETFEKPGGSGLGFPTAKETIEAVGGTLEVSSIVAPVENHGTVITIKLPLTDPPRWFVPKIELTAGALVVVLDDDQSIHQIWRERFSPWIARKQVELLHLTSASEARALFLENPAHAARARFLFDYELIKEKDTGLSLAREFGIEPVTTIVTSHYDEADLRSGCDESGIRLIPKVAALFVPIEVYSGNWDAVLVDDDSLTHEVWRDTAEAYGKRVLAVESEAELRTHAVPKTTPIYVDRNLARGVSGDALVRRLVAQGFTELYLATGERPGDDDPIMGLVRGVIGKEIPEQLCGGA